jgi:HK97 gp10 family phage protein
MAWQGARPDLFEPFAADPQRWIKECAPASAGAIRVSSRAHRRQVGGMAGSVSRRSRQLQEHMEPQAPATPEARIVCFTARRSRTRCSTTGCRNARGARRESGRDHQQDEHVRQQAPAPGVGQAAQGHEHRARSVARAKAPKDTGFMASYTPASSGNIVTQQGRAPCSAWRRGVSSCASVLKRGGANLSESGEYAGGDAFHWRFIEFGTSKMAARPFMRPALAENIQKVSDTVHRRTKQGHHRIARTGK